MKKNISCLRCRTTEMRLIKKENIQLGQTGWIFGDLPNLLAGSLEVEIYCCPSCGKLEFFRPLIDTDDDAADEIAKITCPNCGGIHDMDYPKCPYCKYDYNES